MFALPLAASISVVTAVAMESSACVEISVAMESSAGVEISVAMESSAGLEISVAVESSAGIETSIAMETSAGVAISVVMETSAGAMELGSSCLLVKLSVREMVWKFLAGEQSDLVVIPRFSFVSVDRGILVSTTLGLSRCGQD